MPGFVLCFEFQPRVARLFLVSLVRKCSELSSLARTGDVLQPPDSRRSLQRTDWQEGLAQDVRRSEGVASPPQGGPFPWSGRREQGNAGRRFSEPRGRAASRRKGRWRWWLLGVQQPLQVSYRLPERHTGCLGRGRDIRWKCGGESLGQHLGCGVLEVLLCRIECIGHEWGLC